MRAVLLTVLIWISIPLSAEDSMEAFYKRFANAVVGISCLVESGPLPGDYYGAGAVISADGHILTNLTVVPEIAINIQITFSDGRIIPAEIVAIHDESEATLLKLSGEHEDLAFMELADDQAVEIGDPVLTWGNPDFSIQRDGGVSLSIGRITSLARIASRDDQSRYVGPVIETDAAVNPGGDGGPLTDSQGRLLGIQSLAFADRSWLGLIIPISEMRKGVSELEAFPLREPANKTGVQWQEERDFHRQAQEVAKSVVSVWVERQGDSHKAPASWAEAKLGPGELVPRNLRAQNERQLPEGSGSGFIVSESGLVVTTATMVGPRRPLAGNRGGRQGRVERVFVFDHHGKRYKATILGRDNSRDIAVLQIEDPPSDLSAVTLPREADESLVLGTELALLGRSQAPGNLSMSIGIISGLKRNSGRSIQTSALMNYGNIGGPVINRQGRVLGMANGLSPNSSWRQNCGVGFYYQSSHLAKAVDILSQGKKMQPIPQPLMGVRIDSQGSTVGARVTDVVPSSPAAEAGIQSGDIIVSYNSLPIRSHLMLIDAIEQTGVNKTVQVVVLRDAEEVGLELTIKDRIEVQRAQREARRKEREARRQAAQAKEESPEAPTNNSPSVPEDDADKP